MKYPAGRIPFEYEREDLAKVVREVMERRDTNIVGGNISIKVQDETGKDYYVMTPTMMSEAYMGYLNADQILVIEPHTRKVVSGNGKVAYKQTVFQQIGVLDGYYSEGTKIGTWEDVKAGKALYNKQKAQNKKGD